MKTTPQERKKLRKHIESRIKWLNANTIYPDPGFLIRLLDDIDTLRAALEQVEWMVEFYGSDRCPWCDNDPEKYHAPDCARQLALKEVIE